MIKFKGVYSVLLILISIQGLAQGAQNLDDFYRRYMNHQFQQGDINQKYLVEGSPHENGEFIPGILQLKDRGRYEDIPLRYNIYADEIEFMSEGGQIFFLHTPEMADYVLIGADKYIYTAFSESNRLFYGFFKVVAEGRAKLLVRQTMQIKEAEKPQPYKDAEPARFIRMPDAYYVLIEPAAAHRVSNKKEMLSAFFDSNDDMNDFARKNRIRYKQLDDLVRLVAHYNSLHPAVDGD